MLSIIPISDAGIPIVKWGEYAERHPTEKEIESWRHYPNRALICGKISNVIAIDIDTDDAGLIATIERQSGFSPVRKRGTKGYTAFFRYSGEQSHVWQKNGKVVCELLSDKRLTTIPPSVHRITGKPYVWLDGVLGEAVLPKLPDSFVAAMDAIFPKPQRTERVFQYDRALQDVDLSEAEEMLRCIDAGCSREQWIQIGMALRSKYGDTAYCLWHDWSARGGQKYNRRDADSAWRSFNGDGVTIGTLVYYAKEGGYMKQPVEPVKVVEKVKEKKISTLPVARLNCLVNAISDWIYSTAISPQRKLADAAALAFMSAVKGRRVKHAMRGTRTNLLIMSLAPTGGGKDYPQQAIDNLAVACGLDGMMMGRPTSGTGLLTGLDKAGGLALLCIDEMGRYLQNVTASGAQPHLREISDYMVELYSKANQTFRGRQYGNDKDRPQISIDQPHFVCLGSTVTERFKSSCTGTEIVDGFLNRWLIFSTMDRPEKSFTKVSLTPPEELVAKITAWMKENPIELNQYGKSDAKAIEYTPEAWEVFLAYEKKIKKLVDDTPYPYNELYVRSGEQVSKVSLILCDDICIGTQELKAAIEIVDESNKTIIDFAGSITNSKHEESVMYVLNHIRKAGTTGISTDRLTQSTRKLTNRERKEILEQLVESGELRFEREGKKITFFVAS